MSAHLTAQRRHQLDDVSARAKMEAHILARGLRADARRSEPRHAIQSDTDGVEL
jgi:hypothetical protein